MIPLALQLIVVPLVHVFEASQSASASTSDSRQEESRVLSIFAEAKIPNEKAAIVRLPINKVVLPMWNNLRIKYPLAELKA